MAELLILTETKDKICNKKEKGVFQKGNIESLQCVVTPIEATISYKSSNCQN